MLADKPLLLGLSLNIVLGHLTADGDEPRSSSTAARIPFPMEVRRVPTGDGPDQRRTSRSGMSCSALGYAIVSREDGVTWQLGDHGQGAFEELDAVDEPAERRRGA